jgi:hypothetical protein
MANGNAVDVQQSISDAIDKVLEIIPGDLTEKMVVLATLGQTASVKAAKLNAAATVCRAMIREETKVQRAVAARLRHQQSFGFGMSVDRSGPTKQ